MLALHDSALFESVGAGLEDDRGSVGNVQPGENENVPVGKKKSNTSKLNHSLVVQKIGFKREAIEAFIWHRD